MIDCADYATALRAVGDGLWVAASQGAVWYPDEGNENFRAIEERSFWYLHRNRCITAAVRHRPPTGVIFDVGGGNGFVSLALQQAGYSTVVVEPTADGARNALARGLRPVIVATLEGAGFRPHVLPAAGMFDVLEHIPDDVDYLRRLRAVLVPGGMLYLTVPAYQALWSSEDDADRHQRRYTLSSLRRTLTEAGFTVEWQSYMFAWLPLPILLLRALPSRAGARGAPTRERTADEHALPQGVAGRALRAMLDAEYRWLSTGRAVPFGGSCLVAARAALG